MDQVKPTEENGATFENGFSYFVDLNNELSVLDFKRREMLECYNHGLVVGLKLQISRSLAELIEQRIDYNLRSQWFSERFKVMHFPISMLKIGKFTIVSLRDSHLVAKCYFGKRKLVWEILDKAVKRKIEVNWSDIFAMRAVLEENKPGILEIELSQLPRFFNEIDPQPRRHALWNESTDFTGGEASLFRRHYLEFTPGLLDKHYERLLKFDSRLLQLSQGQYPRFSSPYFDQNNNNNNNTYYGVIKGFSDVHNDAVCGPHSCSEAIQQQTFPSIAPPPAPVPLTQQAQQIFGNAIAMPSSHVCCVSTSALGQVVNDQRLIQDQDPSQMAFESQGIDTGFANLLPTDFTRPLNASNGQMIEYNNQKLSNYAVRRPLITNNNSNKQFPASDFRRLMRSVDAANDNAINIGTPTDHFFVTNLSSENDALTYEVEERYHPASSIAYVQQQQQMNGVGKISARGMPLYIEPNHYMHPSPPQDANEILEIDIPHTRLQDCNLIWLRSGQDSHE